MKSRSRSRKKSLRISDIDEIFKKSFITVNDINMKIKLKILHTI